MLIHFNKFSSLGAVKAAVAADNTEDCMEKCSSYEACYECTPRTCYFSTVFKQCLCMNCFARPS